MTVSYAKHVHTVTCGGFLHLFRLWKGSLIKGIWKDLLLYIGLFSAITIFYRHYLLENQHLKEPFEILCVYCRRFSHLIPLSFLLGFYVSLVVTRWWSQFTTLAWPDTLAMSLRHYLPGDGEARDVRRTVVRWALVSNILALRQVSPVVEKRFPSYESMVDQGILTQKESNKIEKLDKTLEGKHQIVWYPIQWACALLQKVHKSGVLPSELHFWYLIKECIKISRLNSILILILQINIPLVYTQVVTIAVYSYFLASLFGSQYLQPTAYMAAGTKYVAVESGAAIADTVNLVGYDTTLVDTYIPIFNILEFVFYVGWLQVAVALINPFGEDDEDFDVNYLIDRNFQIGLFMVEEEQVKLEACPPCAFEYSLEGLTGAQNLVNILTGPMVNMGSGSLSTAGNLPSNIKAKMSKLIPTSEEESRSTLHQKTCLSKFCCCCDPKSSPSTTRKQLSPSTHQADHMFQLEVNSLTPETKKVQSVASHLSVSTLGSKCSIPYLSSEKHHTPKCTCNCSLHEETADDKSSHKQQVKTQKVSPVFKNDETIQNPKVNTKHQVLVAADILKVSPVRKSDEQLQSTNVTFVHAPNIQHIEQVISKDVEVEKLDASSNHQAPITQIIQHIGTQNVYPLLKQDQEQLRDVGGSPVHQDHFTQNIQHVETQNVFPVQLQRPSSFRTLSPIPLQQSILSFPPTPSSIISSPTIYSPTLPSPTTSIIQSPSVTSRITAALTLPSSTISSTIPPSSTTSSFLSCTSPSSSTASYCSSSTTTSPPPIKGQLPRQQTSNIVRQDSTGPHSAPLPHRKFNF